MYPVFTNYQKGTEEMSKMRKEAHQVTLPDMGAGLPDGLPAC